MMTQPIRTFKDLTSETSPAGGNDLTKLNLSFEDRRLLEMRARYARAELMANALGDAVLWLGRQWPPSGLPGSRRISNCAPPRPSSSA